MRQVHSGIGSVQVQKSKVTEIEQKTSFKYKNYLHDAKMARTANGDSARHHNRDLDEIKRIMKKENVTQEEKFYKAKLVAQKLEDRSGGNSKNIVDSIYAKI